MGALSLLKRLLIDVFVVVAIFLFIPGIPPYTSFKSYKTDEPRKYEGPLSPNNKLDNVERLFDGRIVGPESVASRSPDEIFVSVHGGKIVRIWGDRWDHLKIVTSIGPGCAGPWEEHVCGRPLGLRFAADGRLLVADSYLGIFAVDVETGEKELLVDPSKEIAGKVPRLIDDLDIDDDGNIYWSDASTISSLADGVLEYLSDGTGRLVKYDPTTRNNTVLIKDVHFANGVQLSPNQDFVLVCETFKSRVLRFWLKGPKSGKVDVFVDKLPGSPDNIRPRSEGGYYISLIVTKNQEKFDFGSFLARVPYLRKFLSRFLLVIKLGIDGISKVIPNNITPQVSYMILHTEPLASTMGPTIVVEVDEAGAIVGSLQGKIDFISETARVGDHLFFGSPYNKYLGHLFIGEPKLEVDGKYVRVVSPNQAQQEEPVKEAGEEVIEQVTEEVIIVDHSAEVQFAEEKSTLADEEKSSLAHEEQDDAVEEEDQAIMEEIEPYVKDPVETAEKEEAGAAEEQQEEVAEGKANLEDQVEIAEEEKPVVAEGNQVEAEEQVEAGTVVEEIKAAAGEDEMEVEDKFEAIDVDEAAEEEQVEAAIEEQIEAASEKQVEVAVEEQVEAAREEQVEAPVETPTEHASPIVEEPVEDVQKTVDHLSEEEEHSEESLGKKIEKEETGKEDNIVDRLEGEMTEHEEDIIPEVETHRKEEL